jgi:hypothetical protein
MMIMSLREGMMLFVSSRNNNTSSQCIYKRIFLIETSKIKNDRPLNPRSCEVITSSEGHFSSDICFLSGRVVIIRHDDQSHSNSHFGQWYLHIRPTVQQEERSKSKKPAAAGIMVVARPPTAARNESPPNAARDKERAATPHDDNHDDQPSKEEEAAAPRRRCGSLSSQYGTATGIFQSLSLLLNAALMVYAHMGLSAVFVSNQVNIGEAIAAAETAAAAASTPSWFGNNTACSVDDRVRWTSVIGPHGRTGAQNQTFESSYCSTQYINPDTRSLCLIDANCIAECFTTLFNYTAPCADCFATIPYCSLIDGCTAPCSSAPQSSECHDCTLRCVCLSFFLVLFDKTLEAKALA